MAELDASARRCGLRRRRRDRDRRGHRLRAAASGCHPSEGAPPRRGSRSAHAPLSLDRSFPVTPPRARVRAARVAPLGRIQPAARSDRRRWASRQCGQGARVPPLSIRSADARQGGRLAAPALPLDDAVIYSRHVEESGPAGRNKPAGRDPLIRGFATRLRRLRGIAGRPGDNRRRGRLARRAAAQLEQRDDSRRRGGVDTLARRAARVHERAAVLASFLADIPAGSPHSSTRGRRRSNGEPGRPAAHRGFAGS